MVSEIVRDRTVTSSPSADAAPAGRAQSRRPVSAASVGREYRKTISSSVQPKKHERSRSQLRLHTFRKIRLRYSNHTGTKQTAVKLIEYANAAQARSGMRANTCSPRNVITSVRVPADVK